MSSILDYIGNTPIVRLQKASIDLECNIWAKCEFLNPGGSIKDRVALSMIQDAKNKGITGGIIEPTSGNTGIGLALVCACLDIDLTIVMPDNMSYERRATIKSFGAKLVLTPANKGMQGSIDVAKKLSSEQNLTMLNQFANPSNALAHYNTTAPEIYKSVPNIDIFVAGVGSGGTISGIGKYLKEQNANIEIFAVEPSESAVINNKPKGAHLIEGIGAGFIPELLDVNLLSSTIEVSSQDAINMAKTLPREGLFCGISSGANIQAIYNLAKTKDIRGKNIVTILPDSASRYLSTKLFQE